MTGSWPRLEEPVGAVGGFAGHGARGTVWGVCAAGRPLPGGLRTTTSGAYRHCRCDPTTLATGGRRRYGRRDAPVACRAGTGYRPRRSGRRDVGKLLQIDVQVRFQHPLVRSAAYLVGTPGDRRRDPARVPAARLVPAGHARHPVRDARRHGRLRRPRQEPPPRRLLRPARRAPACVRRRPARRVRARPRARALPGDRRRHGADRPHPRGDPRLRRVESPWIVLETAGVDGLEAMLAGLKRSADDWPYTVGWIDCLARGRAVGRGILMRGRHADARWRRPAPAAARIAAHRAGGRSRVAAEPALHALVQLRSSTGCTAARSSGAWSPTTVLLPARRGVALEPALRPPRLHPVPVRAARAAGAAAARRDPRAAGAAARPRSCVIKDCGPASEALPLVPAGRHLDGARPGVSATRPASADPRAERGGDRAGGRVYLAKDASRAPSTSAPWSRAWPSGARCATAGIRAIASAPPSPSASSGTAREGGLPRRDPRHGPRAGAAAGRARRRAVPAGPRRGRDGALRARPGGARPRAPVGHAPLDLGAARGLRAGARRGRSRRWVASTPWW